MTKPRPNRLGMYSDVQQVLDAALASDGGEYVLDTHGKAIHWRQRAYKFRKLYAEILGPNTQSPYDAIIIRRPVEGSGKLILDIRRLEGEFRPTNPPTDFNPSLPEEDDLLGIAEGLARKLEEGEN